MEAYAHKADKSKVDIGSILTAPDAPNNADEFYFDYQNGKYGFNTDPDRGASTFHPFKKGAIYLGEYSANTTINVSALSPESAAQFLLVPSQNASTNSTYAQGPYYDVGSRVAFTNGTLSLSGNTLTVTLPTALGSAVINGYADHNTVTVTIPCKVYYVGDIESAS